MLGSHRDKSRAFAVVLAIVAAGSSAAQSYPNKPVRMLSAGLGGGSDVAARLIAHGLSESLGQPVVVDTRVGGVVIADIAAKAAPDGYTLLTYSNTLWLIPLMRAATPYDPIRDFAPITLVGTSPMVLVTHPSVPANSVKELIALAREKPGGINFATGPSGAVPHLAGELFKAMAGVDIVQIAYKGVGVAVTDVLGGRVQMMFPNASAALPHVKSGRLRGLAVTSAQASPMAPGLPTLAASGLPGYECVAMYAVFAPARTPVHLAALLNREIVRVLARPEVRDRFHLASTEVIAGSAEELTETMKTEMTRMGKVVRAAGIRIE